MKLVLFFLLAVTAGYAGAQGYKIEINSGNHDGIISAYYDRERNQLVALDKAGFVVCWDISNFSIINKFQLPPESPYVSTKKEMLGKYEIRAWDSIITITYPAGYGNYTNGERIVDMYNRRTGAFIMQTPFGRISSIAFTKDRTMISAVAITAKQGLIEILSEAVLMRTDANNKNMSVPLDDVPNCIQPEESKRWLAIGYRSGKVEIRDLYTLRLLKTFNDFDREVEKNINQLVFIPASDKIAFTAERSGKIIIRDIKTGLLADSMELEQTDYRIAASPSGRYITVLYKDFYHLYWRDIQKKTTEKKLVYDNRKALGMFLSEVFFLNDDMLIGTGRNSLAAQSIKATGMGNVGAWLGLIDTRTNMASANFNITTASSWIVKYGTQMRKRSPLVTTLQGFSDEYAYMDPSTLSLHSGKFTDLDEQFMDYMETRDQERTYATTLRRTSKSSAADFADPGIAAIMFNKLRAPLSGNTDTFLIAYYHIPADSFIGATKLVLPEQEAYYYNILGGLHQKGLVFFEHTFRNTGDVKQTELVIFDASGKKLFTDNLVNTYSASTIAISPDEKYLSYQPEPGKLLVRSLKDFPIIYSTTTGFSKYQYDVTGFAYPRFIQAKPSVLLHEASLVRNNNRWFCLLSTDITTKATDTVLNFALRPLSYEADSSGSVISLVYNYDFTDSAFTNTDVVQKAAMQAFKPLYQPTVMLYDIKTKDFVRSVHTGQPGISTASLNNGWLTVLQNDGQLLYFNTLRNDTRIAHVIDGNAQALVADSFYYASKELLPLIKLKVSGRSFAAAGADVFLNRPHAILQQFIPGNRDMIKPYELAYNKRIAQQSDSRYPLNYLSKADGDIRVTALPQHYIHTNERKADLTFMINDKSNVSKIRVMLNGQPASGRNGIDAKKALAEKKVSLELSAGENFITLAAETANGTQSEPVKYYYYFEPKVYKAPKLYFFSAGVSEYKDSTYNLKYAAKDAGDILQAFQYKVADTLISQLLQDKDVTRSNINAWVKQIEKAGVDDIVILYFAGHGLLDQKNNFYYATHEMNFQQPEKNGISYEALLDILDKSPSRKKILLLDACHSGSFDKAVAKQVIQTNAAEGNVVSNEKRGFTIKGKPAFSERQAFILMNQVFANFSEDIGIDVIAASLGNSYALEKADLQNGLFTYAMIRAVGLSMASGKGNETGTITMDQVKRYVDKEVKRLSNGEQVPSIRSSNVQSAMIEFLYSWSRAGGDAFQQFLEKYK